MSNSDKTFVSTFTFLSIAFLILFLINGIYIYRKRKGETFSFLRNFPYEFEFASSPVRDYLFKGLIFAVPCFYIGTLTPIINFVKNINSEYSTLYIIITIVFLLGYVSYGVLFYSNLKRGDYKGHFILVVVSLGLVLFALMMLANFSLKFDYVGPKSITITVFVGLYVLGIVLILITSRGKLLKLDKEVLEDGTIVTKRPKVFFLAFFEWMICLGFVLFQILNLVEFLTI